MHSHLILSKLSPPGLGTGVVFGLWVNTNYELQVQLSHQSAFVAYVKRLCDHELFESACFLGASTHGAYWEFYTPRMR